MARSVTASGFRGNESEWLRRRELGGGVLIEVAVHTFDLWRFLLQSEIEEISAESKAGQWEDETATVTVRMANGVLATAALSKGVADNSEIEFYGRHGRLRLSNYRFDGLEVSTVPSFPGSVQARLRNAVGTLTALPHALAAIRRGGDYLASFQAEWRHFLAAIQHNAPLESTLEDGRRSLQAVLAAVASASRGSPVQVSQAPRTITPMPSGR
jgi:myo-inositol 2-dehydrogenase/D-chiro-inositol 1-dehydrogenase